MTSSLVVVSSTSVSRTSAGGLQALGKASSDPDLQLDRLIEVRSRQREQSEGDAAREALWAESVRKYHEGRTESFKWGWITYHHDLARTHQNIADEHTERAAFLLEMLRVVDDVVTPEDG